MTDDPNYLVDTGVFILYFRGDRRATTFFRATTAEIYYSRITRKELLRPPISSREREEVLAFLQRYRLVNPDPQIAEGFSVSPTSMLEIRCRWRVDGSSAHLFVQMGFSQQEAEA